MCVCERERECMCVKERVCVCQRASVSARENVVNKICKGKRIGDQSTQTQYYERQTGA